MHYKELLILLMKKREIYYLMRSSNLSLATVPSLVWMFCSRRSNNLINDIHERALRATFDDHTSNFAQLLDKKRESTIHQRNIPALMKEIHKFIIYLSPPIIDHLFQFRENSYNLRNFQQLASSTRKTT